jgi:hypothetical protein
MFSLVEGFNLLITLDNYQLKMSPSIIGLHYYNNSDITAVGECAALSDRQLHPHFSMPAFYPFHPHFMIISIRTFYPHFTR